MGKERKSDKGIDWSSMTRNNQYKSAPSISKQHVAEPKPALARDTSSEKIAVKKSQKK